MKKKLVLLGLALVMLFSLAACGGNESKETQIMNKAKQTYLENFILHDYPDATIDDVTFEPFLGIYNDILVAVFYGGKYHGSFTDRVVEYIIDGFEFSYGNGSQIRVWNSGNIYELDEAYRQGMLAKENLVMIHNLYYNIGI